ncbi:MAG: glutaminyl-peptide cyclotransferase [Bacteroidales bacterium]|nr:glutaminyl-peptide cyclotransferase [Bacteroidales bacterium]
MAVRPYILWTQTHFTVKKRITVADSHNEIGLLNELEHVEPWVLANIYGSTKIAFIEPVTGKVSYYLDLSALVPEKFKDSREYVLNGIAFDPKTKHLFVTGKYWPYLYEIKLNVLSNR